MSSVKRESYNVIIILANRTHEHPHQIPTHVEGKACLCKVSQSLINKALKT